MQINHCDEAMMKVKAVLHVKSVLSSLKHSNRAETQQSHHLQYELQHEISEQC